MSLKSLVHHVNRTTTNGTGIGIGTGTAASGTVAVATNSPLYILGAGSIGLFFASCMQMQIMQQIKNKSESSSSSSHHKSACTANHIGTYNHTTSSGRWCMSPCLLLRSHHRHQIIENHKKFINDSTNMEMSDWNRNIIMKNHVNVLEQEEEALSHVCDDDNNNNINIKMDGYAWVAFKDILGVVSLLKIPSILIQDDEQVEVEVEEEEETTTTITTTTMNDAKEAKQQSLHRQQATTAYDSGYNNGYIENILLCTKAPDAVNALKSIIHLLHPTKRIKLIIMTNGSMGVVYDIKQMLLSSSNSNIYDKGGVGDRIDIIYASTYHGVHRGINDEDFELINSITNGKAFKVLHAGLGQIFIQDTSSSTTTTATKTNNDNDSLSSNIREDISSILSHQWSEAGLRSNLISSDEMYALNWKKLAANCAINPLTALRQCKNGEILNLSSSSSSMSSSKEQKIEWKDYNDDSIFYQIIREVSNVAIIEAQRQDFNNEYIHDHFSYDALVQFVGEVVKDTSNNKSSMYQDILHRRYPTEIHYLNGYVAKLGRECYGIDVSANEFVTDEIDKLTRSFVLSMNRKK